MSGAKAGAWTQTNSAASDTAAGVVELATSDEAVAGTDTSRAVTAVGVAAAVLSAQNIIAARIFAR